MVPDLPDKAASAAQALPSIDLSRPSQAPADTLDVSTPAPSQAHSIANAQQPHAPRSARKTLPTVVGASSKKAPKPQLPAPSAAPVTVNDGPALDIPLVDLFAGLRTVRVAARGTRIKFVLTAAAEKCPSANKLAKHNNIIETLFGNIRNMDETWAKSIVAEAIRLKASAILVVGGFPCKGLSRARGAARENLKHKMFILFWQLKRIIDLLEEVAGTDIDILSNTL